MRNQPGREPLFPRHFPGKKFMVDDAIIEHRSFEWRPVLAGGLIAAAASFLLIVVGAAIGLSLAGTRNLSGAHSFLTIGAIYFLAAEAFGFALGGYVTGRLMRPQAESEDEHFRADVHGLAVWALAVVIGLIFVGLAAAAGLSQAAPAAKQPMAYWADRLLINAPATDYAARNDMVARLLAADIARPNAIDRNRLLSVVAGVNRLEPEEATRQVALVEAGIHVEADNARKALLYLSMWTAFALLFGGFVAIAATVMARFHKHDFHPRDFRLRWG
jgi:hypothetical protein